MHIYALRTIFVACLQKSPMPHSKRESINSFDIASSLQIPNFWDPKIVFSCITIHCWLHIAHCRGLCVSTSLFCMTLQVGVVVPPTYFVKWTITFWLSSLIPRDHGPIVYFILLLWVLGISEIAKIVDPGLWNSTSFICAVAWITSSSSTENMLCAPEG